VRATPADLDAYYTQVKRLYGMQCSIDAALPRVGGPTAAEELGTLRRRLNWLVDQVGGGYTGRPTAAQIEWIGIFEEQLKELLKEANR
jgi:hypothetical protein